MGALGQLGYECKPCGSVYIGNVNFHLSPGGEITIDKCYARQNCENINHNDWMCTLFHGGENFCTQGNTNVLRPAHLEYITADTGLGCVSNDNKNCSEFNLDSVYPFSWASGNFAQSDQHGTANWNTSTYTWNVSSCMLQHNNLNITQENKDCKGNVWRSGATISGNAATGYTINYSNGNNWYYCTHCDPGKKPEIFSIGEAVDFYGCNRYESGGSYIACACSDVELGFYSDGCDINYPLDSQTVPNACHKQCPENMTTLNPGASGVNDCVPDGSGLYSDLTGWFRLGSTRCE